MPKCAVPSWMVGGLGVSGFGVVEGARPQASRAKGQDKPPPLWIEWPCKASIMHIMR